MTAHDLRDDSDFIEFVKHWANDGVPPLPFADWLRDRGMDGQADAVQELIRVHELPSGEIDPAKERRLLEVVREVGKFMPRRPARNDVETATNYLDAYARAFAGQTV